MLERKFAVHITRKSGYENAARAVPGRAADRRRGERVIGAGETLVRGTRRESAGVRVLRAGVRHNEVMEPQETAVPEAREKDASCYTRFGVFPECPLCGGSLTPEHAHFKCFSCGWRDSCCD